MSSMIKKYGIPTLSLMLAGCAEMCAAEDVAMGVSRLTTLNADALVNGLNADTECGFEAISVKLAGKATGEVGKIGTFSMEVKDCALDFGAQGLETSKNCEGKATKAFGKATVSGTKTITGYLTGNLTAPIIPEGPDSVVVTLDATFDNFHAEKDGSDTTMTWISGGLSGTMMPRLAVSAENGACAIQTTNTAFKDVVYKATKAHLKAGDTELDVDIDASNLAGQYGLGPSGENTIAGTMSVWGESHTIPVEGDTDGLDPDYEAAKFLESYSSCNEKIAKPVSYSCDLKPMLAQNAARGLVKILATATSALEGNQQCGFSSAAAVGSAQLEGSPGSVGSLTMNATDCTIAFDDTVGSPDCSGTSTVIDGTMKATTTRTMAGLITGDQANPIVPGSRTALRFEHSKIEFTDFKVWDKVGANGTETTSMKFTGSLTGVVKPVLGERKDIPNVYAVPTPVGALEDLVVATGTMTLKTDGKTFVIDLKDIALDAFNGSFQGKSNSIEGAITANGAVFSPLPSAVLNPAFDQAAFDASYACHPQLKEPVPAN